MEISVTTNLQKMTFAEAKKVSAHCEHSPYVNHSNSGIDFSSSDLNSYFSFGELTPTLNSVFGHDVEVRNRNYIIKYRLGRYSASQLKEAVTLSGADWVRKKRKTVIVGCVATLGNFKDLSQLMESLGIRYTLKKVDSGSMKPVPVDEDRVKYKKLMERAFKLFADGINGHGFKAVDGFVHLDEVGAPHVHLQLVMDGKTAKGKQSTNLNKAIERYCSDYGLKGKDNRERLSAFRQHVDSSLITAVNAAANELGLAASPLELARTGRRGGMSMAMYKRTEEAKAAAEEAESRAKKAAAEAKKTEANLAYIKQRLQQAFDDYYEKYITYESALDAKENVAKKKIISELQPELDKLFVLAYERGKIGGPGVGLSKDALGALVGSALAQARPKLHPAPAQEPPKTSTPTSPKGSTQEPTQDSTVTPPSFNGGPLFEL